MCGYHRSRLPRLLLRPRATTRRFVAGRSLPGTVHEPTVRHRLRPSFNVLRCFRLLMVIRPGYSSVGTLTVTRPPVSLQTVAPRPRPLADRNSPRKSSTDLGLPVGGRSARGNSKRLPRSSLGSFPRDSTTPGMGRRSPRQTFTGTAPARLGDTQVSKGPEETRRPFRGPERGGRA